MQPPIRVESATAGALPIAPSFTPAMLAARVAQPIASIDRGVLRICLLALLLGAIGTAASLALTTLIDLITNLAWFGRWSTAPAAPRDAHLGFAGVLLPVAGGLIVGLMARYGSKAIRGHGIPEAVEQILTNESRIPPRIIVLKPLSAAISIGTGGPFGAEGPIIATGGAIGSLVGQILHTTADERKTLLACGAAAGMCATFGSPLAAVLLAVELLLFELRARSLIPVALASATAAALRLAVSGHEPVFSGVTLLPPTASAILLYALIGAAVGLVAVGVTKLVYGIEDAFEKLPIHWMWWPMLGGIVVGLVGLVAPRTLGVGYDNIEAFLHGDWPIATVAALCGWKFVSWAICLASGTSGGTLAPLLTIGSGLGAALGVVAARLVPSALLDPRAAALVGMAALFAGASRAVLASLVFAFETTHEPNAILPLLAGCAAAHLISSLAMRTSIMTEKIARRGVHATSDYSADVLAGITVAACASRPPVALDANLTASDIRSWLETEGIRHQGFPVVDKAGNLVGVLTRRDLNAASGTDPLERLITRPPLTVFEESSVREAAEHMVREGVGRLVVVARSNPLKPIGILTRSDILTAHLRVVEC